MRYYLAALSLIVSSCSDSNNEKTIQVRNGDLIPNNYPNVVKILHPDGRWCVGTAIDSKNLLTSASCVGGWEGRSRIGEWYIGFPPNPIKSIDIDAGYTSFEPSIDLARLTLTNHFQASWYASIHTEDLPVGKSGMVVGYGWSSNNSAGIKNIGWMRLDSISCILDKSLGYCVNRGLVFKGGSKNQLACEGDWGAPIFIDGKVAGIMSFADGDCSKATASNFVRVHKPVNCALTNTCKVQLTWNPVTTDTKGNPVTGVGYKIHVSTSPIPDGVPCGGTVYDAGTATTFTFGGLGIGTYYFRASAYKDNAVSGCSNEVNKAFTTELWDISSVYQINFGE
jgi:hypothetical protein